MAIIPPGMLARYITHAAMSEEIEELVRSLSTIVTWSVRNAPLLIVKTKLRLGINPSSPPEAIEMIMPRIRRIVYQLTIRENTHVYWKNEINREDLVRDGYLEAAEVYEHWQTHRNDPEKPI